MIKKHHPTNRAERLRLKRARDTLDHEIRGPKDAARRKVLAEEAESERVILSKIIDQFE